jgi:hypothetical protein
MWDEERSLDRTRVAFGWATLVIFVLCFMAVPIELFL